MAESTVTRKTGEGRAIDTTVESFSVPDVHYVVRLYFSESGAVVGADCNCPSRQQPFTDKHVVYAIAEEYGKHSPRVGRFVREQDLLCLEQLSGVSYFELSSAFCGERVVAAKAVVSASLRFGDDPEEWGRYIRSWGRRYERGKYHPAYVSCPEGAA